ncbi:hypothetical protein MUO79_01465 [Candidatus Bathyarchaeota archaeon]|nr:hypothetical protein [Candidatus Bathyarchaeota archaeon]
MGKKITALADNMVSIGKVLPLVLGGIGGFFVRATGGRSPYECVKARDMEGFWNDMTCNYTFYNPTQSRFESEQGNGVKILAAGIIIHKLFGWIMDG